eukprot:12156900-Heterocapsa_arctica.AAC.1
MAGHLARRSRPARSATASGSSGGPGTTGSRLGLSTGSDRCSARSTHGWQQCYARRSRVPSSPGPSA